MSTPIKDPRTVPPSTPDGPKLNLLLTDEEYRDKTWPGDDPAKATGEGNAGSSHPIGMPGDVNEPSPAPSSAKSADEKKAGSE